MKLSTPDVGSRIPSQQEVADILHEQAAKVLFALWLLSAVSLAWSSMPRDALAWWIIVWTTVVVAWGGFQKYVLPKLRKGRYRYLFRLNPLRDPPLVPLKILTEQRAQSLTIENAGNLDWFHLPGWGQSAIVLEYDERENTARAPYMAAASPEVVATSRRILEWIWYEAQREVKKKDVLERLWPMLVREKVRDVERDVAKMQQNELLEFGDGDGGVETIDEQLDKIVSGKSPGEGRLLDRASDDLELDVSDELVEQLQGELNGDLEPEADAGGEQS